MANDLAKPMQAMLTRAARTLPATTGETARYSRLQHTDGPTLILCDVSYSMASPAGGRTRYDHLVEALKQVYRPEMSIIAFSAVAVSVARPEELPHPSGGTALHAALAEASKRRPAATLVISDGEPNEGTEDLAISIADQMTGRIDVIYCGPDNNAKAIKFLNRLAKVGAGSCVHHSWSAPGQPRLAHTIQKLLLGGPSS